MFTRDRVVELRQALPVDKLGELAAEADALSTTFMSSSILAPPLSIHIMSTRSTREVS